MADDQTTDHAYLSTACLHGRHERCGAEQLARGDLGAPHCKYCPAVCCCVICDHVGQAAQEARLAGLREGRAA